MILLTLAVRSQGFDWQYSSRLPFDFPYLFGGLNGSVGYSMHDALLNLSEGTGDCCKFQDGKGWSSSVGLKTEYWIDGLLAVNAQLSYFTNRAKFIAEGHKLPFTVFDSQGKIVGHDTVLFGNEMEISVSYLTFEAGGKRRLFDTHLFAGAALEFGYLVSNKTTQIERVVTPSYFKYNDGSQVRTLGQHKISGMSKFLFTPKLLLGYDIPVGLDFYLSPVISVGFPVNNMSNEGSWKIWNFNFGISVMRAVAYK
jgi:hypothetical protein